MINRRTIPFGAAALFLPACSGAQTKDPVVTVSDDGKSTSPSGDAVAKRGTSFVRFVNAMPGDAGLNLGAEKGDLFGLLPKMALEAGKAYTIVLTGKAPNQLAAFSFDDTVMTGTPLSLRGEK